MSPAEPARVATSSGSSEGHRPDIQGLRAIAVLAVLLFHAGLPLPGGFTGVDMFFVVSGFVITQVLLREWANHGRIRLGRFYLRRIQRLAPALAVLCLVTVLVSILLQTPFGAQQTTAFTAVGAMMLAANVVIAIQSGDYFAAASERNPLLHTWSLGVEEQFYSFFPLLLLAAWTVARRKRLGASVVVGILSVLSFILCLFVAAGLTGRFGALWSGFYAMPPRIWEFGVGSLLTLAAIRITRPGVALAVHLVGILTLLASFIFVTPDVPFPGPMALLPVLGTALLLIPGPAAGNVVTNGLLSSPALVRIGDWSYSLYLWHWPFVVFAKLLWPSNAIAVVGATLASFVPAVASFYFLERPLRRRSLPSRRAVAKFVAAALVPSLAAATLLWAGARAEWGLEWPQVAADVAEATNLTDCLSGRPSSGDQCIPPQIEPSTAILLVGDSQAGALLPGVVAAAKQAGREVFYTSVPGCPFVDADSSGSKTFDCRAWQRNTLQLVETLRPTTLIIANRSVGYTQPALNWRTLVDASGKPATTQQEATDRYEVALGRTLDRVTAAAADVILADNMIEPDEVDNEVSLLRRVLPPSFPGSFDGGRSYALRQPAVEIHQRMAARFGKVKVVDPWQVQCRGMDCPMTLDGVPLYSDSLHLSPQGARLVVPEWLPLFERGS